MLMACRCAPHSLFETSKRECAAPGGREKMFRRVGPRQRGPPAAGGRRLAFPRGSQGRKRAALGEIYSSGKSRIHPALISAAAGLPLRGKGRHTGRPLQDDGGLLFSRRGGPACPPAGKALHGAIERQRVQEQGPCVDHPGFQPHRTRGSRPKQTRSPARAGRRPTSLVGTSSEDPRPRGGPLHRSAAKRFFSLDRPQPVSLFGAPKREMGGGSLRRGRISPPKPAE